MKICMAAASVLCMAALLGADEGPVNNVPKMSEVGMGWAKTSNNTVKFRHAPLATYKDTQFIAYYDGDCKVIIGKRKLGDDKWELKDTGLSGNKTDAHNTISMGVDGAGFVHLAWNHHNNPLNYVKSKEPMSLELVPAKMDGIAEKSVTYPEFYSLPNGDMLLLFRDGSSGNGALVLKRYTLATMKWTTVHDVLIANHDTAKDAGGRMISYNAYWEMCIDAKGTIHLAWVWRGSPDVASNHNICYAKSEDGGKTWTTSAGKPQTLPINAANCETVWTVPTSHDLMNQTSISADGDGHPYVCTYFMPGKNPVAQVMVVYFDGTSWNASQVGERKTALNLAGGGTKRPVLSRPLILVEPTASPAKVNVVFRDIDRGDKITLASTSDISKGAWVFRDLTDDSYGSWEPTCDENLWARDHIIDLFVQKTDQLDGQDNARRSDGPPPSPVKVLDFKP